jgi:hypothetical protein
VAAAAGGITIDNKRKSINIQRGKSGTERCFDAADRLRSQRRWKAPHVPQPHVRQRRPPPVRARRRCDIQRTYPERRARLAGMFKAVVGTLRGVRTEIQFLVTAHERTAR